MAAGGVSELEFRYLGDRVTAVEELLEKVVNALGQISVATRLMNPDDVVKDKIPEKLANSICNCLTKGGAITPEQYDNIIAFSNSEQFIGTDVFCSQIVTAFQNLVFKYNKTKGLVEKMRFGDIKPHLFEISKLSNHKEREKEKDKTKIKELAKDEQNSIRVYCVQFIPKKE